MKKHKKDILFLFICTLPVTGMMIYWLIWEQEYRSLPWALLPQAVMALCIGIMFLQEKRVLKRESRLMNPTPSKQWQSALEKYEHESSGYRNILSETMAKDLKKIYRSRLFPLLFLFGALSLSFLAGFYIFSETAKNNNYLGSPSKGEKIFAVIFAALVALFGIACILTAIYEFLGLPVLFFIRKNRENADAIERSYMEGKMICGKLCGINVGFEYCIYYDLFGVDSFAVRNIGYAEIIKRIKKKKDRSGFYNKIKIDISLKINVKEEKFPYTISVREDQLEYICGELTRRGVNIVNNNFKEK